MDAETRANIKELRELVWGEDIPSPTTPECIEHHESIGKILCFIDDKLLGAVEEVVVKKKRYFNIPSQKIVMALDVEERSPRASLTVEKLRENLKAELIEIDVSEYNRLINIYQAPSLLVPK